jgi:hypothetical protein
MRRAQDREININSNTDERLRGAQALKLMMVMMIMMITLKIVEYGVIASRHGVFMQVKIYPDIPSTVDLLASRHS